MSQITSHIEVRAVQINDARVINELEDNFETDRIYALHERNQLLPTENHKGRESLSSLTFELVETAVDPPYYQDFGEQRSQAELEEKIRAAEGGYVALCEGKVVGCILLHVNAQRAITDISELIISRQYRRYGVASLLLNCAADWARERKCWSIMLEMQSTNFPAIQSYLRYGLQVWSINRHFYPPGPTAHAVAILMGKRLSSDLE